jgi:AraC-like DNA-binding protein
MTQTIEKPARVATKDKSREPTATEVELLAKAEAFILENFQRGPSIEEIGKAVGLSKFYFHRVYKRLMGITLKQRIDGMRMEKAAKLLLETSMPLGEVAQAVGFCHQSAFTSRFHRLSGNTPARFRRAAREVAKAMGPGVVARVTAAEAAKAIPAGM